MLSSVELCQENWPRGEVETDGRVESWLIRVVELQRSVLSFPLFIFKNFSK